MCPSTASAHDIAVFLLYDTEDSARPEFKKNFSERNIAIIFLIIN